MPLRINKKYSFFIYFILVASGLAIFCICGAVRIDTVFRLSSATMADRMLIMDNHHVINLGVPGNDSGGTPVYLVEEIVSYLTGLGVANKSAVDQQFLDVRNNQILSNASCLFNINGSCKTLSEVNGMINDFVADKEGFTADLSDLSDERMQGTAQEEGCLVTLNRSYRNRLASDCSIVDDGDQINIEKNVIFGNGLVVNGELNVSCGVKSFVIEHPLKENMTLVHAVLEGPESAVYYRGQGRLNQGKALIRLPDYFEALTEKDGRTVILTPSTGRYGETVSLLAAGSVRNGAFEVLGDGKNQSQEFYWEVKAIRADVPPLIVEKPKEF